MLPAGVLAKHGYTTALGFFAGVCHGSGHLPFEHEKSLIEGAISQAEQKAAALRAEAEVRAAISDPNDVVYNLYLGHRWGVKGGYYPTKGRLVQRPEEFGAFFQFKHRGQPAEERINDGKPGEDRGRVQPTRGESTATDRQDRGHVCRVAASPD